MSKSALFATKKSEAEAASSSGATPKPASKTAGMKFSVFTGISDAVKTKNVEDAKKAIASAEEALKTSLFQWKPDYISAAPYFERASGFYKTAGMTDLSREFLLKCADCHDQSGSYAGAATAYAKSAVMADEASHFSESQAAYVKAAERWGLAGDMPKYSECFWRAGKEAGKGGGTRADATELFTKALKTAYPAGLSAEDMKRLHPQLSEIVRSVFSYYLAEEMFSEAHALAVRMVELFAAQELEASANKARACVVLLALQLGDVVAADQAFLEHLSDSRYLKSVDCRITEEYLMAFKFSDPGRLESAQKHADNYVFEREMQEVLRAMTLRAKTKTKARPKEEEAEKEAEKEVAPVAVAAPVEQVQQQQSGEEEVVAAAAAPEPEVEAVDEEEDEVDLC